MSCGKVRWTQLALVAILAVNFFAWGNTKTVHGEEALQLVVVNRLVVQEQGSWRVNYQFRYEGSEPIKVAPKDILAKTEGWVSNSRVPGHSLPLFSSITVSGLTGKSSTGKLVNSVDPLLLCREEVRLRVWLDNGSGGLSKQTVSVDDKEPNNLVPLRLTYGVNFRVELTFCHKHDVYGEVDPLLSMRSVELVFGPIKFCDIVPMDREQYVAQPPNIWTDVSKDRCDTRYCVSPPDSLYLAAHIPGKQYFRFPERRVRYNTKMRLRFWYLIAAGTEGECRVRVAQYVDTPNFWKVLSDASMEETLPVVGRWAKFERIFRTDKHATTVAVDIRISSDTNIGEMWVDDKTKELTLEPIYQTAAANP